MNIQAELNKLIERKRGNKELAVFFLLDRWSIHLGNPNSYVMLGEVTGEFEVYGKTIEECIHNMNCQMDILYGD